MNLTWPNVEDGHMWGYITLLLILLVLVVGCWLENRINEPVPYDWEEEGDFDGR